MAFVTFVIVGETHDTYVDETLETVQLQFTLMFVALFLEQRFKAVFLIAVLGATDVAQRLATVPTLRSRSLQFSLVVTSPTYYVFAGLEQVGDHVLHGEVHGQRFASLDRMSTDWATHL